MSDHKRRLACWLGIAAAWSASCYVSYRVGSDSVKAGSIAGLEIFHPITVYSLVRAERTEDSIKQCDKLIDIGIIDACGMSASPFLTPRSRETLGAALRSAFMFRRKYPYVLVEQSRKLSPWFNRRFIEMTNRFGGDRTNGPPQTTSGRLGDGGGASVRSCETAIADES
jgi:hypothetical protein